MAMVMNLSKGEQGENDGFIIEIEKKETKTITFKLDVLLLQRIDEVINRLNRSLNNPFVFRSDFIRHALDYKLQKHRNRSGTEFK